MGIPLLEKISEIKDLPTLPEIVGKLNKAIEDPNTSANDIAMIMADDPAVTAKILRLVNSAYYGRVGANREITSIPYAVARMGFREVKNIVLSLSAFNLFQAKTSIINLRNFWKHCVSVAITTRVILDFTRATQSAVIQVDGDSLYVAGLLHDIGILVMNQYFPKDLEKLVAVSMKTSSPLHMVEQKLLGTDHAELGSLMADRWQLPESICRAIKYHHRSSADTGEDAQRIQIVNLADFICNLHWPDDNNEGKSDESHLHSLNALGIPIKSLSEILDVVEVEASKSEVLVEL